MRRINKVKSFAVSIALFLGLIFSALAEEKWTASTFFAKEDVGEGEFLLPYPYSASKYGHGKYRLDGPDSRGQLNCIFFWFESAAEGTETTSLIEWQPKVELIGDTRALVKETLMLNPFQASPPAQAAMLKIRLTALSDEIAERLQKTAEAILKKNAKGE